MVEQQPASLTQVRQYDTPSDLRTSASQNGFIPNALIRFHTGYSVYFAIQSPPTRQYPSDDIRSLLTKECGDWLEALKVLPKLEEVNTINLYCQPALIPYWNDMRDKFVADIRALDALTGREGEWEITSQN